MREANYASSFRCTEALSKDVESVDGKVIVEKDVLASATAEIAKLSMRRSEW
jgi:hypothetical protein